MSIDLAIGEGRRIWEACLERTSADQTSVVREPSSPRYGEPVLHAPRLGQAIFRIRVLDAYDRACAVTHEHSLPVLEAAHIRPYATGGDHAVSNGLVLRSDLHRLFDRGYVTVDDGERLVVGRRLKDEFENGRSYYGLHGHLLSLPSAARLRPDAAALAWHREQVFLG
jgi:putative restriction endonuclease